MTTRSDLKKRVRARQAKTGESYTTARAHVIGALKNAPQPDLPVDRVQAVVLKCNEKSIRIRIPGETGMLTLRCDSYDAWRLKPAQLIDVTLTKRWTWQDDTYASGTIHRTWFDVTALDLEPLPLDHGGTLELEEVYQPFEPSDANYELWKEAAAEPREEYEFHEIAWGAGIFEGDSHPVSNAAELRDRDRARELLMEALLEEPRCIDAHVHLGNERFDRHPEHALEHYAIALAIGELSLPEGFDGILPWGCLYNRPFLRALHGYGLCVWRAGDMERAEAIFERSLALNPSDNQGVRFCWDAVRQGKTWSEFT